MAPGRRRTVLLLQLLLRLALVSAALAGPLCDLAISGGESGEVAAASLHCKGGSVTAAVAPRLRKLVALSGVTPSPNGCGKEPGACLLAICGSSTASIRARITGVADPSVLAILGIYGSADITLLEPLLAGNLANTIVFVGDEAAANITRGRLRDNQAPITAGVGGQGSMVLQDSVVAGNSPPGGGVGVAAVSVEEDGRLLVLRSRLEANSNVGAGALSAKDNARVQIVSSSFANNTGSAGAGLGASGRSVVDIVDTTFAGGSAQQTGGALALVGSAAVRVSLGVFEANEAQLGGGAVSVGGGARFTVTRPEGADSSSSGGNGAPGRRRRLAAAAPSGSREDGGDEPPPTVFANNTALGGLGGGALYVTEQGVVDLTHALLVENEAPAFGGAGVLCSGGARARLRHSMLLHNAAVPKNGITWGGGVWALNDCQLTLEGTRVIDNEAGWGGGLYGDGKSLLTITDSVIADNTALDKFGGGLALSETAVLRIADSIITNNTAGYSGGGLATLNAARSTLDNVTITANNATQAGGGMSVLEDSTATLAGGTLFRANSATQGGGLFTLDRGLMRLTGARVTGNNASLSGGGLYLGNDRFTVAEVQAAARGNSAKYASDIAVQPRRIAIVGETVVPNFVSRLGSDDGLLPVKLRVTGFQGLPADGWGVKADMKGANLMNAESADGGLVDMKLKVRQPPGNYTISFGLLSDETIPPATMTVEVASCGLGDVTVGSGDACETCSSGTFSLNPANPQCDECPAHASCPGGAVMEPLLGYWHSAPRSSQMHRCINPLACQGNRSRLQEPLNASDPLAYKTVQCSTGYTNNLCGVCAPGYGKTKPFTCGKCMAPGTIIVLYVLASLSVLGFLRVMCHFTLADTFKHPEASSDKDVDPEDVSPTDVLKPFTLYMQYMMLVSSLNVPWPPSLLWPFKLLGWFLSSSSPQTINLECLISGGSAFPVAARKVLFGLGMPAAMLFVLLVVDWSFARVARRPVFAGSGHLTRTAIVVVFFFSPTITRTIFSLFACVALDTPAAPPFEADAVGRYWEGDMAQRCFRGYHLAWALAIGIPAILIVCVACPVAIAIYTTWRSKALTGEEFLRRYGFLVRSYRPSCCAWEAIVSIQTSVLVAVSVFGLTLGAYFQGLLFNACLAAIMVLLMVVRPHANRVAVTVALQAMSCLLITSYASLSFLPYGSMVPNAAYTMAMGVLVMVVNLAFALSVGWRLLRLIDWLLVRTVVQNVLRCGCCKRPPRGSDNVAAAKASANSRSSAVAARKGEEEAA